jgi:hypothetical protein
VLTPPLTAQTSVAQVAQWIADSEDPERTDKERVAVMGQLLVAINEWRARAELGEGEKRTLQNAVECLYYQGAVDDAEALAWHDFTGAASTITPFTVWNFQAWFRDPAAGGSSFNLSDGLEILFLP